VSTSESPAQQFDRGRGVNWNKAIFILHAGIHLGGKSDMLPVIIESLEIDLHR
jgi:hypothetical protein